MYRIFIILLGVCFISNQASAKNSTKTRLHSNAPPRITKEKDHNRLPNRKGSLTQDPIFDELLNNKPGPPRRKRVRTFSPISKVSFPSGLIPTWPVAASGGTQMLYQLYLYLYR